MEFFCKNCGHVHQVADLDKSKDGRCLNCDSLEGYTTKVFIDDGAIEFYENLKKKNT